MFLKKYFEVIVFCKGSELYCKPVLDTLESSCKYFAHRLYDNYVLFENQNFSVKYYDFLLKYDRTPKNTIIIDSNVDAYCLNLSNGIPICPFDEGYDDELIRLARYLENIEKESNINQFIKKTLAKHGLQCN